MAMPQSRHRSIMEIGLENNRQQAELSRYAQACARFAPITHFDMSPPEYQKTDPFEGKQKSRPETLREKLQEDTDRWLRDVKL